MDQALLALPRHPLAQQAADRIVEAIAAGAIQPGERVTDTDIAQRLGVSRGPVREAVKILQAQGIMVSSPHRGARVAEFDKEKIDQIARARVAIERIAFGDALKTYSAEPKRLAELDRLVAAMEKGAREGDLDAITRADLEFHRAVCVASGNEIILTLWETIARHMRISFKLELQVDPSPPQDIARHHRMLRDALARGSAAEVEQEIENHILRLQRPRRRAVARARAD
jgi:DNA-binding GntR family transcriptional regulator